MSSVHSVVVWEWQEGGAAGGGAQWVPHTPAVTRTLERAHAKELTRVVLADADPALKGHYVNLRTLTQYRDMPDGSVSECGVRRACYGVASVGGRGARWEWARLSPGGRPAELQYAAMPMELQCQLEEAWCAGAETVAWRGWSVAPAGGLARRGAALRLVRRAPQPPYPLTRTPLPHPLPSAPATHNHHTVPGAAAGRGRIPQQHTGSSVHSTLSTRSAPPPAPPAPPPHAAAPPAARGGARSASPRDRKPNLARQILHNLNIFSNNNKQMSAWPALPQPPAGVAGGAAGGAEGGAEGSARRHSVDTVSTYLSHESKDSMQRGSVGELLDCSGGSDDVFESPPPPDDDDDSPDDDAVEMCGAEVAWARRVSRPQWGAVCPVCLGALGAGGAGGAAGDAGGGAVALAGCQHMLHLHCLRDQLRAAALAAPATETVYIECLVCGRAYGVAPPALPAAPPALPPAAAQPPGSMAWRLQHAALPQCDTHAAILVTYNFQSGVQRAGDPAPGARYYAVGFPRHSLLPDDELGRQVLAALRALWSRGRLFEVRASRTTGREHVVAWRSARAPPPAAPHHYLPPARPRALLQHTLHHLHQLLARDP